MPASSRRVSCMISCQGPYLAESFVLPSRLSCRALYPAGDLAHAPARGQFIDFSTSSVHQNAEHFRRARSPLAGARPDEGIDLGGPLITLIPASRYNPRFPARGIGSCANLQLSISSTPNTPGMPLF